MPTCQNEDAVFVPRHLVKEALRQLREGVVVADRAGTELAAMTAYSGLVRQIEATLVGLAAADPDAPPSQQIGAIYAACEHDLRDGTRRFGEWAFRCEACGGETVLADDGSW